LYVYRTASNTESSDVPFMLEKALEAYKTSKPSGKLDWLDKITINRIQDSLCILSQRVNASGGVYKVSSSSISFDGADTTSSRPSVVQDSARSSPLIQEDAIETTVHQKNNAGLVFWAETEDEKALREEIYSFVIEFPQYPNTIIYEDKITVPVTAHNPLKSLVAEGAMTGCVTAIVEDDPSMALEFSMSSKVFSVSSLIATTGYDHSS
jgi:hypothetical protein